MGFCKGSSQEIVNTKQLFDNCSELSENSEDEYVVRDAISTKMMNLSI